MKIPRYKVKYVGIRPGEKIHEWLKSAHDGKEICSLTAERFKPRELIELIRPSVEALL
jgi:FlaA1/EpsC-like NDP-sugar epimerase